MSLALKVFSDNFLKGLQLGTSWQDKAEDRKIKIATAKMALAKMQQQADWQRARLAETHSLNQAKITQAGAYTDYLRRKGVKGPAGPAGPDANTTAFLNETDEPDLANPPPAARPTAAPQDTFIPPPADLGSGDPGSSGSSDDGEIPGQARGGRVARTGKRFQQGGSVDPNLSAMQASNDQQMRRDMAIALTPPTVQAGAGSANAATGSGGDAAGGVSGTGGIGGSATGGQGGSAAAGTTGQGDDGGSGTYRRGGRARRFADGGVVRDEDVSGKADVPPSADPKRAPQITGKGFSGFSMAPQPQSSQPPTRPRTQGFQAGGPVALNTNPAMRMFGNVMKASQGARKRAAEPQDGSFPASAGTGGPGSGLGETAAAPVGYVPGMDDGGNVPDDPETYYGSDPYANTYPNRERQEIARWRAGRDPGETGGTPKDVDQPASKDDKGDNRKYGGNKFGGQKFGGETYGGNKFGHDRHLRWSSPSDAYVAGGGQGDEPYTYFPKDKPPAYEPGDTGKLPTDQTTSVDVGGGDPSTPPSLTGKEKDVYGGASAPAAVRTGVPRRLMLGDQSRTAAYDPTLDANDPRNARMVDQSGAVNPRAYQASPMVHPEAYQDNVGMFGERLDRPGAYPVPARQEDYALQGASTYAQQNYSTPQAQAALYQGHGAPQPTEMQEVFHSVDPENKMPMHEKMMASVAAVHDFWMAKGDPKQADQAAFEVTQFGNTMARQHGMKAAKMLQSGDQRGALNELMAGYGWLPDGGTPEVQNNGIIIRGPDGGVQMTIPIQPGTLENLALGLASGKMGWDVVHAQAFKQPLGGGQQAQAPPTRQPAQPPAAAAGPSTPPPAAAPASPASVNQTPPPAPQVATPTPPGPGVQGPGAQGAPAQTPPPAPAPQPAAMSPYTAATQQGIQTTPPTVPAAPSPATPSAGGAASAPASTGTAAAGQGQQPQHLPPITAIPTPGPQGPPQTTAPTTPTGAQVPQGSGGPSGSPAGQPDPAVEAQKDAEQKHWDKNPYGPVRQANSLEQEYDLKMRRLEAEREATIKRVMEIANRRGMTGKGKSPYLQQVLAAKKKRFDDAANQLKVQYQADKTQRSKDLQPRKLSMQDYATFDGTIDSQNQKLDQAAKTDPNGLSAKHHQDSVLRYATPDDQQTVRAIAESIFAHNEMSPQQAYALALQSTSILRPSPQEKDPVGENRQKGGKATYFRPEDHGDKNMVTLRFGDGTTVRVDKNTYWKITNQHAQNWGQWEHSQTDAGKEEERAKKNALTWKTLGAVGRTVAPMLAPVNPIGAGRQAIDIGAGIINKLGENSGR